MLVAAFGSILGKGTAKRCTLWQLEKSRPRADPDSRRAPFISYSARLTDGRCSGATPADGSGQAGQRVLVLLASGRPGARARSLQCAAGCRGAGHRNTLRRSCAVLAAPGRQTSRASNVMGLLPSSTAGCRLVAEHLPRSRSTLGSC